MLRRARLWRCRLRWHGCRSYGSRLSGCRCRFGIFLQDGLARFHAAIDAANAYHELKEKPYIYWKLPDTPPPDLDLRPRGAAKK